MLYKIILFFFELVKKILLNKYSTPQAQSRLPISLRCKGRYSLEFVWLGWKVGVDGKIREEIKNECVWLGEERGLGGENGGPTKIQSSLNGEREREREREWWNYQSTDNPPTQLCNVDFLLLLFCFFFFLVFCHFNFHVWLKYY